KKDPPLQPPRKTPMMVDSDANNNPRQPDPQRTIAPKPLDAAITAHQRFLDDVLRVGHVSCRSDGYLQEKRTVLPGSRFEIDVFCSNSYRLHPPMSVLNDSPEEGGVRNYFLAALVVFNSSSFFLILSISSCSVASWTDLFHSLRASP